MRELWRCQAQLWLGAGHDPVAGYIYYLNCQGFLYSKYGAYAAFLSSPGCSWTLDYDFDLGKLIFIGIRWTGWYNLKDRI